MTDDDRLTPAQIAEAAAAHHGCTVADIFREHRGPLHVARARQLVCVIMREHLHWSYSAIGQHIGRDHTSVMHACREYDGALEDEIETLRAIVRGVRPIQPAAIVQAAGVVVASRRDDPAADMLMAGPRHAAIRATNMLAASILQRECAMSLPAIARSLAKVTHSCVSVWIHDYKTQEARGVVDYDDDRDAVMAVARRLTHDARPRQSGFDIDLDEALAAVRRAERESTTPSHRRQLRCVSRWLLSLKHAERERKTVQAAAGWRGEPT